MGKVEDAVTERILPVVEGLGYELVAVEFKGIHGESHLTVFVHSFAEGGTSLEDCERVHYAIDPVLEELDPTGGAPYVLNVSSPGLDRPFKTRRDFERNYGKEAEVKLYAPAKGGKKGYEGVLKEFTGDSVVLTVDGEDTVIPLKDCAYVRPLVRFE